MGFRIAEKINLSYDMRTKMYPNLIPAVKAFTWDNLTDLYIDKYKDKLHALPE